MPSSIVDNIAGASSDLFKGFGDLAQGNLKAKGLNLDAQGQRLNAQGLRIKASGDLAEASNYDLAGNLALKNEQFTTASTAIKQAQTDRSIALAQGSIEAETAGAGLKTSGSSLDVLRDSAEQGALTKQVAGSQGLITEAGYEEQRQSYATLANAGREAAAGQFDIANKTDAIAAQTDQLANDTRSAAQVQAAGDFTSSLIKGATAVAAIALL